jgi:hypothetical protein
VAPVDELHRPKQRVLEVHGVERWRWWGRGRGPYFAQDAGAELAGFFFHGFLRNTFSFLKFGKKV